MAFGFFKKKEQLPAAPADDVVSATYEDESGNGDEDFQPEAEATVEEVHAAWIERARAAIPGGASTGSKRVEALFGDEPGDVPGHFIRAHGCVVHTAADRTLIDCTMALGSVALGYGDDGVAQAVLAAVAGGAVSGLSHTLEVEIAERLIEVVPCAEQVRFMKTGAEAVSAAVRIARTATGRSHVICSGYFGWHDWATEAAGIPASAHADITRVAFDDVAALDHAVREAGDRLAAICLEPVVERLPDPAWIARAREHASRLGAVLILDEMKTGFRLARGGYHELAGVSPDLAVFGKAMANGFPVAAVVGRRDVMDAARRSWISSTHASEAVALAAVGAVLDRHEEVEVCGVLARAGASMREGVRAALAASGVPGTEVVGLDQMWLIRFADAALEGRFLRRAAEHGVLFKRGAYNYAALAHDDEAILLEIERAASSALVDIREGFA